MELKVLVDNNTIIDRYYVGEPGVSYLLCDGETKILFDVGYSDIFINNALQMGESLLDINYLVISHGHNDHTGGLVPLAKFYAEKKAENIKHINPILVSHPDAFLYKEYEGDDIGSFLDNNKITKYFDSHFVREPLWITNKVVFLGEVNRSNHFENIEPIGKCEKSGLLEDDYVRDDSALVYKSPLGLVIITGCSHVGICNIIEYAKKVCNDDRIVDVIGGFHLLEPSAVQAQGTLSYFANSNIPHIHPCHCTSLEYKIKLAQSTNVMDVGVGLAINY